MNSPQRERKNGMEFPRMWSRLDDLKRKRNLQKGASALINNPCALKQTADRRVAGGGWWGALSRIIQRWSGREWEAGQRWERLSAHTTRQRECKGLTPTSDPRCDAHINKRETQWHTAHT